MSHPAGGRVGAQVAQFPELPADVSRPVGLASALFAGARLHPQRTALRDAGDRAGWCGRPSITWTYAAAAEIAGRLARGIGEWRLPAASRIGLCFSGGAEAVLALLAVEAAGHVPCLLSPLWDGEALSAAVEAAGLVALVTEGRRGRRRPAEEIVPIALRHFSLRYVAAFGPGLPDGVISLDAMALERGVVDAQDSQGLITFAAGDPAQPVYRSTAAFEAAIAAHRAHLPSVDRVLTLLPPHDLRGLVTGIGTALSGGACLESLVPFDAAAFRIALVRPIPTRLVVPAAFEAGLAEVTLPWTVRAVDVVHRPPVRLPAVARHDVAGPPRLDVLSLDEDVILTRSRGQWNFSVDSDVLDFAENCAEGRGPFVVRRADGRLMSGGLACCTASVQRRIFNLNEPSGWRETAYQTRISQGRATILPVS